MRPGEKLYEELLIGHNPEVTEHARIMKAREEFVVWAALEKRLEELKQASSSNDLELIKTFLQNLVQNYQPALIDVSN